MTESKQWNQESKKATEVAAFVAGGGALSSGMMVAGSTAIGISLLPIAALGMVVGLAAYGVKQALFDDVTATPESEQAVAISQEDSVQTLSNEKLTVSHTSAETSDVSS